MARIVGPQKYEVAIFSYNRADPKLTPVVLKSTIVKESNAVELWKVSFDLHMKVKWCQLTAFYLGQIITSAASKQIYKIK